MSASIVDNLQAYKVELEELQADCVRQHGDESPAIAMSIRSACGAISVAVDLLARIESALPVIAEKRPHLAAEIAALLQQAKSEAPA